MSKEKPKALGRGLDALFSTSRPTAPGGPERTMFLCSIERLVRQEGQPRQHFDDERIDELAASIKSHGLLEPLVVRRIPGKEDKFEIIAGERRFRASQRAGLTEVPVVVKDVSPKDAFELALVENVQREDLNPIELAEALDRLVKEHGHTHDALAQVLHKDRSTITNALRLLRLPARVRSFVIDGRLSEGHARALLGATTDEKAGEIADKVVRGRLTVRQTEELVRGTKPAKPAEKPKAADKTPAVRDVELRLARRLGSKVELRDRKGKGEIVVAYGSLDELDRLLAVIGG
jgi:ParB family chromosome partitioning protein